MHNSFVVRDAQGKFSTVVGGTASQPDSLIRPTNPHHWFWLGDVSYLDGLLQVPLIDLRSTGAGSMDFAFVASALAVFDPSDLDHAVTMATSRTREGIDVSTSESAPDTDGAVTPESSSWAQRARDIGTDWWATIVAGVIVAAAVAGVLPKIPW